MVPLTKSKACEMRPDQKKQSIAVNVCNLIFFTAWQTSNIALSHKEEDDRSDKEFHLPRGYELNHSAKPMIHRLWWLKENSSEDHGWKHYCFFVFFKECLLLTQPETVVDKDIRPTLWKTNTGGAILKLNSCLTSATSGHNKTRPLANAGGQTTVCLPMAEQHQKSMNAEV